MPEDSFQEKQFVWLLQQIRYEDPLLFSLPFVYVRSIDGYRDRKIAYSCERKQLYADAIILIITENKKNTDISCFYKTYLSTGLDSKLPFQYVLLIVIITHQKRFIYYMYTY